MYVYLILMTNRLACFSAPAVFKYLGCQFLMETYTLGRIVILKKIST